MRIGLVLVCLILSACTDFDAVDRGVCGNGLLEPGEDCDSTDASCQRCAVVCTMSSDCPDASFACGIDNVCHAPSGGFAEAIESDPLPGSEFAVTDIDGDGVGDLLGASSSSITVRYGAPNGVLARVDSLITPQQRARPSLGDVDRDGTIDVAISAPDGIVTYTSRFGELSAVAAASQLLGDSNELLDIYMFDQLTEFSTVAILADEEGNAVLVVTTEDQSPVDFVYPCLARFGKLPAAELLPDGIDLAYVTREPFLNAGQDPIEEGNAVLALSAAGHTCVLAIHTNRGQGAELTDITPASFTAEPRPRALLARLHADDDLCPDLVDSTGGAVNIVIHTGQMNVAARHCEFAPTSRRLQFSSDNELPPAPDVAFVGVVDLTPRIPTVSADALVGSDGVYGVIDVGGFGVFAGKVFEASGTIVRSASGDFNGDGVGDGVLVRKNADDLDVLFLKQLPAPQNFTIQAWRVDTEGAIGPLVAADYDGNGIDDIAFVAQGSFERVQVSYGTPDRPLPPTTVVATDKIRALTRTAAPDSADPASLAADLVTLDGSLASRTSRVALFKGSSQRTLISYFDPRPSDDTAPGGTAYEIATSVIAKFEPGERAGVLALATPKAGFARPTLGYYLPATATGLDTPQGPGTEVALGACRELSSAPCVADARFLAWPTSSGLEVAIGVDEGLRAAVLAPAASPSPALVDALSPGLRPVSLHAATLDAGGPRLIAAFAGGGGRVLVCSVSGEGMPTACEDIVPTIAALGDGLACRDAAPVRIARGAPTQALAVACGDDTTTMIYGVELEGGVFFARRLAAVRASVTALRSGDVTGDGVDDLIGLSAAGSVYVLPQCTSRDPETCAVLVDQPASPSGDASGRARATFEEGP